MSIKIENACYVYGQGTSTQTQALKNVNLKIEKGEFIGIIGHTGSGKSTLIQLMNGLEKPAEGKVLFDGEDIWGKKYNLRMLRCKVGLVFQYPEHQLFEETVLKDVCFGPMNQGLSKSEAEKKAKEALQMVGIREEKYELSPFELSGGQKRRVAIAGVLAMEPDFLILDEPTAGLDPAGRDKILNRVKELHDQKGIGIILVSHSMEDVARYAKRLIVMNQGKVMYDDLTQEVFKHYKQLEKIGLSAPQITYIMHRLKDAGLNVDTDLIDLSKAKDNIMKSLVKKSNLE